MSKSEYEIRLEKLEEIKKTGINPYPAKFDKQNKVSDIQNKTDNDTVKTAGRIMSIRVMGKLIFAHLQDFYGKAQICLREDKIGKDNFKFFQKKIDMGDFIGVTGAVFTTQKGEKTLLVNQFELLTKALLPLPEKWHGLKDEEDRLRKRYLDLLMNQEVKELFIKKSKYYDSMRNFLKSKGFMEVETPVIENTTGGADARPFVTHHNALDIDVYLRISVGELWQKRLMVGSFEKTFEMGRIFRNEGMDAEHLQDYTSMEFYWAYANWQNGMQLVEELIKHVAQNTFGTLKFKIKGFEVDLDKKWEQYDYRSTILKNTDIDIEKTSVDEIKNKLQNLKVEYDDFNDLGRGIDQLWKYCRKSIAGPGYLVYPPKSVSPLAKESPERPGYVERYQLILAGSELCNGYSELNDPIDQEERFKVQADLRDAGDDEAQMHDEEFVEALKHGMPPTTGLGISERLFAFLADKTLRECTLFPLMRPKNESNKPVGAGLARLDARLAPSQDSSQNQDLGLTYDQATKLVNQFITDEKTRFHLLESEAIMRGLAKHLSEDEEKWGIVGLLHDIDWDMTKDNTQEHCVKCVDILQKAGGSDFLINTVISHAYGSDCGDYGDKKRSNKIEYALAAAETLTGLIFASALMQPDKKLASVNLASLKKKFKDKRFAANCNRAIILECEQIGLSLDEFLEIGLTSMQNIATKIGL